MQSYDVAVIGAGPAGMMAAITAARPGKRVVLIERNEILGRKLMATGNGRCNLTNTRVSTERYHGADESFTQTVLQAFNEQSVMRFFEDLGLMLKVEEHGRVFPRTNQAASVVELLRFELEKHRVHIMLNTQVKSIARSDKWTVTFTDSSAIAANTLIVATGGRAAHHFGSTGDGLYWAEKLGHTLTTIHAALVPIETCEAWPIECSGVKVEASVRATCENRFIRKSAGDVLFTDYGVSGPAVMAVAGCIAPLLPHSKVTLHIDLFPDKKQEQLAEIISRNLEHLTINNALIGLVPNLLIPQVLAMTGPKANANALAAKLKDLTLTVSQLRRLKEAQVTSGGVDAKEIEPTTLESKLVPGLRFAGEVIDVDGDSGGYNLQWAWSSGYVAGSVLR